MAQYLVDLINPRQGMYWCFLACICALRPRSPPDGCAAGRWAQTHEHRGPPDEGRTRFSKQRMRISTALSALLVGAGGEGVSAATIGFESAGGSVRAAVQGVSELTAEMSQNLADDVGAEKTECNSYDDDGVYTNVTCAAADSLACRYVCT